MIDQRIQACTKIYEDEFEILSRQFEKITQELDEKKNQFESMRVKMNLMSVKITSYDKMIEGTGYDVVLGDQAHDLNKEVNGVNPEKILDYTIELNADPESIEEESRKVYSGADRLLKS